MPKRKEDPTPAPRKAKPAKVVERKESPLDRKEWGYDPLLGLESIKTTMGGLLAELFTRRGSKSADLPHEPPIDLYEDGKSLIIEMAIPGAQKEDIHMHAYHNLLIISGETRPPREVPADKFHFHERQWGPFQRSIPLPFVVVPENIKAALTDGVLTVTLPVEGKRPSRSVRVKIE